MRRDLPEIIRTVAAVPGIDDIALTTNGWKLPTFLPDWIDAGLTRLNVSIDSLDPRQFKAITGHDRLQDLLDGLAMAHEMGFNDIKVNAVLMRGHNADQLPHFLNWIRTTPVDARIPGHATLGYHLAGNMSNQIRTILHQSQGRAYMDIYRESLGLTRASV